MEKKEICKQYFAMHKKILLETQFNNKVDLNIKIQHFKKDNHIILRGSEPILEVFVGAGIESEFVGQIITKYAKKDKNLECKKIGYDYKIVNL